MARQRRARAGIPGFKRSGVVRWRHLLLRIDLPVLMTIGLFLAIAFLFLIPTIQNLLMDRKRAAARDLTSMATSLLEEMQGKVERGEMSLDEAQAAALSRLRDLRYGPAGADYFWVTDTQPRMLMHPYKPQLDGQDLSNYADARGKKLFIEMVVAVDDDGEGFVDYLWQYKGDETRVEEKLSHVRLFKPWNWIVGTGIYLGDVQREMHELTSTLIWVSIIVTLSVTLLQLFVAHQSMQLERRRSETQNALEHSRESYKLLLNSTAEGIFGIDLDGCCTFCNAACLRILGYDEPKDLLGRRMHDLIHCRCDECEPVPIESCAVCRVPLDGKGVHVDDESFQRADGSRFSAEYWSHPIRDDGEIVGAVVTFLDISARKEAEQRLARHQEDLERLVDLRTSELTEKNRGLEKAMDELQATQTQLVQSEKMAVLGRLSAGVAHEVNNPLGAVKSAGNGIRTNLEAFVADAPWDAFSLDEELRPLFLELIRIASDGAKVLRSSREKREARHRIEESLVQHGIDDHTRTITNTLVELGLDSVPERFLPLIKSEEGRRSFEAIKQLSSIARGANIIELAANRAAKIVFSLKSYARQEDSTERTRVDLAESIDNVLMLYHHEIKGGVELVRDYGPSCVAECSSDEISQVWVNLVFNALQAMEFQGRLTISVQQVDGNAVVRVVDTGCGMPSEVLDKVFTPFFTTKPTGQGCGLGLDIVRRILESHGGDIRIESEVGQGTAVTVRLPLATAANPPSAPKAASSHRV